MNLKLHNLTYTTPSFTPPLTLQRDFRLQLSLVAPSLSWHSRFLLSDLDSTLTTCPKIGDHLYFLRASRALALHFPPIQRVADVSERIEDLSDIPDADIDRMKAIYKH